jgi:hypothetical protein
LHYAVDHKTLTEYPVRNVISRPPSFRSGIYNVDRANSMKRSFVAKQANEDMKAKIREALSALAPGTVDASVLQALNDSLGK